MKWLKCTNQLDLQKLPTFFRNWISHRKRCASNCCKQDEQAHGLIIIIPLWPQQVHFDPINTLNYITLLKYPESAVCMKENARV